tara:strand:- start:685 stop:918 length:234 start_codon:yes stop_codon:yes gene_type:complete
MRKKKRFYPRKRNGKVEGNTGLFPYIVRHQEKEVLFLIGNGVGYMAIPTMMKSFPEGYRGVCTRNRETFRKYELEQE